jgi:hypothetical protein
MPTPETPKRRSHRTSSQSDDIALRDAITPYLAIPRLRRLIAEQGDLYHALRCPDPPSDVLALLDLLRALLQPAPGDQIKSPSDAAGLLVDMSALDHEQMRTVLLDTKRVAWPHRQPAHITPDALPAYVAIVRQAFALGLPHQHAADITIYDHVLITRRRPPQFAWLLHDTGSLLNEYN